MDHCGETNISYFADKVVIKQDVGWFKVTVDDRCRFRFVEEDKRGCDFPSDSETHEPRDRLAIVDLEQPVVQATVFHVLVD